MVCAKAQMAAVSSSVSYTSLGSAEYGMAEHVSRRIAAEVRREQVCQFARIRSEQPSVLAAGPHDLDTAVEGEPRWERVQLLERELEVAISEENYADAMRLRDQLANLRTHITPKDKFLLLNIERLKTGTLDQKLESIDALGEHGDERVLSALIDGLRDTDPNIIFKTEKASWKIFLRSGDAEIDNLLKKGIFLLETVGTYSAARDIFSQLIEKAPTFAEGYNKRATANYLLGEFEKSIEDCKITIQLNPYHFAARSGLGLCYAALKDHTSAIYWFEQAYGMHHGLSQIKKCIDALKQVGDKDVNI